MWIVESQFFIGNPVLFGNPSLHFRGFTLGAAALLLVIVPFMHVPACKPSLALSLQREHSCMHGPEHVMHYFSEPFFCPGFSLVEMACVASSWSFLTFFLLHYHKKGCAENRINILIAEFPLPSSRHKISRPLCPAPARWVVCAC